MCAIKSSSVSTGSLNALLRVHVPPIYLVVSQGTLEFYSYEISSWRRLHAYMLSAFILSAVSYPAAPLARRLERQSRLPLSPFVLKRYLRKFRAPTADRDRPVSRRSEPSSRTALIGEQPNPWELLHPQDAMSRHRGAKPLRRCGRSGAISLLSPEYLLSDERWPCHSEPPDHYARLSSLLDLWVSQSSRLLPLRSMPDCQTG